MDGHQVHFGFVQINEFSLVVGDNPACHIGPAIELSWDRLNSTQIDLDAYEITRRRRRAGHNLILSQSERMNLLKCHHALIPIKTSQQKQKGRKCGTPQKSLVSRRTIKRRENEASLWAAMDDIEKRTAQLAQKLLNLGVAPLQ